MADALIQLNDSWRVSDDPPQWVMEKRVQELGCRRVALATCNLNIFAASPSVTRNQHISSQ